MNQPTDTTTHICPETTLPALADRLRALKDERDDMKRVVQDIDNDIETAEQRLIKEIRGSGKPDYTHAGYVFTPVTKLKASVLKGQRERLHAALRKKGHGGMIYENINANTLAAFVGKQMGKAKKLPVWLTGLVSATEQTTLSMRTK
jgi:hypothetical protein